jgi:inorganic pyrophosphatase
MDINKISAGKNLPSDINVVIEIPTNGMPVKYEMDKDSGALLVDRFLSTSMTYPCNYGFIPNTLSDDGDPVDVLVVTPVPLQAGTVVRSRCIGMLEMEDESGIDAKLLAVPVSKLCLMYENVHKPEDLPEILLDGIKHFFEHYKDLEKGKWVKVKGWLGVDDAHKEIMQSIERYKD